MKRILFFLIIGALSAQGLSALTVKKIKRSELFGIQLEKDWQEFYGRVDSVNSVSIQSYRTSTYMVKEVVIDMHGSSLQLRIYHAGFIDPQKEARRVKDKLNIESFGIPTMNMPTPVKKIVEGATKLNNTMVFKEYPITTHAKTIEFQVDSENELKAFYKHFRNNWLKEKTEEEETKETKVTDGEAEVTTTKTEKPAPRLNGCLFIINN